MLLVACQEKPADPSSPEEARRISADEVLASARETLAKTTEFLDQERKALADRLEKEAIVLNEMIQQLKKEAPEKMAPVIAELEKKRDELVRLWGEVRQLSKEKIDETIQRFHHGWEERDLDSTLEKVEPERTPTKQP